MDFIGKDWLDYYKIRHSKPFYNGSLKVGYPVNVEDIINRDLKRVIPASLGIYHLFKDGELVYIGMSKCIKKRISEHYNSNDIDFNEALWFCAEIANKNIKDIFRIERLMIIKYKPKFNTAYL